MVTVELCPAVTVDGVNATVVALGWPVADSVMPCGLPLVTAVSIVLEPDWPAVSDNVEGDALAEKSSLEGVVTDALALVDWLPTASRAVTWYVYAVAALAVVSTYETAFAGR